MHTQEWNELVDCNDCGATIAPNADAGFVTSEVFAVCLQCAVARGGVYDASQDRWIVPPDVTDVPDERRVSH